MAQVVKEPPQYRVYLLISLGHLIIFGDIESFHTGPISLMAQRGYPCL